MMHVVLIKQKHTWKMHQINWLYGIWWVVIMPKGCLRNSKSCISFADSKCLHSITDDIKCFKCSTCVWLLYILLLFEEMFENIINNL